MHKIFNDFINDKGYTLLCITHTSADYENLLIKKLYRSKYTSFNRKYRLQKITKNEYTEIINELKNIKNKWGNENNK